MKTEATNDTLQAFFAHCPDMLFVAGAGGAILGYSKAPAQALGPDLRKGSELSEIIHPEDRITFAAEWARVLESAEPVQFRVRLCQSNHTYQAFLCSARKSPECGEIYGGLRVISAPQKSGDSSLGRAQALHPANEWSAMTAAGALSALPRRPVRAPQRLRFQPASHLPADPLPHTHTRAHPAPFCPGYGPPRPPGASENRRA
jgi:hypothetical protein